MTRKEMITACVNDQINRGMIKAENKARHIKSRLTGSHKMSYAQCEKWYNEIFKK